MDNKIDNKMNFFEIDTYIGELATLENLDSFYPQMVSRRLNIPLELVMVGLLKCVENKKLVLEYEIRCLDDFNTIKTLSSINEIIGEYIECTTCGEDFQVSYANIFPKFLIDTDYKSIIKKKQKNI